MFSHPRIPRCYSRFRSYVRSYLRLRQWPNMFQIVFESDSLNLSKAAKLRNVVFRPGPQCVEWMTTALQTITPNIKIFDKSPFTCLPTLRSLVSVMTSGDPFEKRYKGNGWILTTSLSNSGSCVQFALG